MKKIIRITLWLLAATFALGSCSPEDYTTSIEGEWHTTRAECDIYIDFGSGGVFELYQRLGEGRYRLYTGSWSVEEDTLSGNYDDGTPWGSSYKISLDGDNQMTLRATNSSGESNTYTRTTIPVEVRTEATTTRATESLHSDDTTTATGEPAAPLL